MAKRSQIVRSRRKQKFTTRSVNRCWRCGRNRGYMRDFNMCRICFRELAEQGAIPGVRRASW